MATTDEPSAVVTAALAKDYGGRRGLADLDLEVQAGEVFGFLGPNGAGKTTTIRLLRACSIQAAGRRGSSAGLLAQAVAIKQRGRGCARRPRSSCQLV